MTVRFRPKITLAETKVDWHHPTHIRFGPGRIKELPEVCRHLGISAPLIVTDHGVSKLPFVKSIIRLNREGSIFTALFSDIFSEPDFDTVKKGAEVLIQGRHDGIIAIGGGSALDAAKAISLASAAGPSRIWQFTSGGTCELFDAFGLGAEMQLDALRLQLTGKFVAQQRIEAAQQL